MVDIYKDALVKILVVAEELTPSTWNQTPTNIAEAADRFIARIEDDAHTVIFHNDGWQMQHPLRERLNGSLFNCRLHRWLTNGQEKPEGIYTVTLENWQWIWKAEPEVCLSCGTDQDVWLDPDPYASEINDDDTPVWECGSCRSASSDEI